MERPEQSQGPTKDSHFFSSFIQEETKPANTEVKKQGQAQLKSFSKLLLCGCYRDFGNIQSVIARIDQMRIFASQLTLT